MSLAEFGKQRVQGNNESVFGILRARREQIILAPGPSPGSKGEWLGSLRGPSQSLHAMPVSRVGHYTDGHGMDRRLRGGHGG